MKIIIFVETGIYNRAEKKRYNGSGNKGRYIAAKRFGTEKYNRIAKLLYIMSRRWQRDSG